MNIDYSQFLSMIPEVTLMALLVIVFIADFSTAQRFVMPNGDNKISSPRAWFNPLVCLLMAAHLVINIFLSPHLRHLEACITQLLRLVL